MMDYRIIQQIAAGVVETSAACDGQLYTGNVTSANPLKIALSEEAGAIELDGDDIILTSAVVSKKIYIKKHTHPIGSAISGHTHEVSTSGGAGTASPSSSLTPIPPATSVDVDDTILEAYCTEYGHKLPTEIKQKELKDDEIVITINRSLEKGDAVIMTRVSHGQQFIVLSRYFEVDKPGKDDE
jgi:hypothetical protein